MSGHQTSPGAATGSVTVPGDTKAERVYLLQTPSHSRLILESEWTKPPIGSNYSVTNVTEAVAEFIARNPEWVRKVVPA